MNFWSPGDVNNISRYLLLFCVYSWQTSELKCSCTIFLYFVQAWIYLLRDIKYLTFLNEQCFHRTSRKYHSFYFFLRITRSKSGVDTLSGTFLDKNSLSQLCPGVCMFGPYIDFTPVCLCVCICVCVLLLVYIDFSFLVCPCPY